MPVIKNTPIGLNLPIRNGPNSGYFDQSTDSFTQIRMNIINLLRTAPGERRMQPTFGCRLWNVVFDQNDDVLPEKVNNIIREDIYRWIPGVSVDDVSVNYYSDDETKDARDIYKLYIVVKFTITSIKQSDVVEIYLDKGKV
jgi:phage baseplate assembly protein W